VAERATNEEIAALGQIIGELLEMLDPHVAAPAYRSARAHGAHIRQMVVPEIDVDVIRLARFVARYAGADTLTRRVHRSIASRPGEIMSVDDIGAAIGFTDQDRKPLWNALACLARRGKIEQVAYGKYRVVLKSLEARHDDME